MLPPSIINYIDYNLNRLERFYPNVNRGGCGITAFYIQKGFQYLGENSQIIVIDHEEYINDNPLYSNFNEVSELVNSTRGKNLEDFGIGILHVMVKYQNYYYDICGKSDYNKLYDNWGNVQEILKLEEETLKFLIKDKYGWSKYFDRTLAKYLQKDIYQIFKDCKFLMRKGLIN